jgi:hypothetical protein
VRKYLKDPRPWPDSLDWPNWQQPHELWYTGHEAEWAAAVTATPDPDAEPEPPPRRRPMANLLSSAAVTAAPSQRVRSVTAPPQTPVTKTPVTETVTKTPVTETVTKTPSVTKTISVTPPISVTQDPPPKKAGRPRAAVTISQAERARKYRARKKTQQK